MKRVLPPEGNTLKHQAQWPEQIPEPVRACLDKELAGAWFNCPLTGSARVSAKLSLAVQ